MHRKQISGCIERGHWSGYVEMRTDAYWAKCQRSLSGNLKKENIYNGRSDACITHIRIVYWIEFLGEFHSRMPIRFGTRLIFVGYYKREQL